MATKNQELVAQRVAEQVGNGGKVSVSKAMRGIYSPSVAKNPKKVTNTKGWNELMEKYLPDNHLGKKHREFLDGPRIVRTFKKGELEIEVEETDPSAVKALDIAYKIKGKYAEKDSGTKVLIINISGQSAQRYGANSLPE